MEEGEEWKVRSRRRVRGGEKARVNSIGRVRGRLIARVKSRESGRGGKGRGLRKEKGMGVVNGRYDSFLK